MKLTFLGTGTSFGVPQIGCTCRVCTSDDPRDRRTRSGALVEYGDSTRVLIDTPPELRLQLVAAGVDRVDALFVTHDHADHTHGIDDLRAVTVHRTDPLPVYGPAEALASLARKFAYVFDQTMRPLPGTSKPEARAVAVEPGQVVPVGDLTVEALEVPHGPVRVFGYRFGPVAYITDAKALPPGVVERIRGVPVLALNALKRTAHPTHLSLGEAVAVAREVGAGRTYLTHLTHDHSHRELLAELPAGIEPAFDGLVVEA